MHYKPHYTRCKKVSEDGRTCYNPTIRHGSESTISGRPAQFKEVANILKWCQQLFPRSIHATATYNIIPSSVQPLFWCGSQGYNGVNNFILEMFDEIDPLCNAMYQGLYDKT